MAPRGLSGKVALEWTPEGGERKTAQAAGRASAEALGREHHRTFTEQVNGNGASECEVSRASCPGHGEDLGASKPKGAT